MSRLEALLLFTLGAVLLAPSDVIARQTERASAWNRLRDSRGQHVSIIDADRREWQGRLLEVAADALVIEFESAPRKFSVFEVNRVDADGDSVRDGLAKGAIFGGFIGLLAARDARAVLGGASVYGLVGLGLDALNNCRHTIYRPSAASARITLLSW